MRVFLTLLILFVFGSLAGWIIEVFWRRFFSNPKVWKNPGFLNGPCLPLYGFGTCLLYGVCEIPVPFVVKVVLFCIVMTLIELVAGLIFIQGMKIKLWDYSKLWGNYKGIICPLYSLLWTILGVAFYFLIYPSLTVVVSYVLSNYYLYLVIGLFYGVFFCDFAISINLSVKVKKLIDERKLSVHFGELKVQIRNKVRENGQRAKFFLPFDDDISLADGIKEQLVRLKEKKRLEEEEKERLRILKKNAGK